jgi:hypothetical protein
VESSVVVCRVDDLSLKSLVSSLICCSMYRKQPVYDIAEPKLHAAISRCCGCVSGQIGPIADLLITAKREGWRHISRRITPHCLRVN